MEEFNEVDALNSLVIRDYYAPDPIVVEAAKKDLGEGFTKRIKDVTPMANDVKKFEAAIPAAAKSSTSSGGFGGTSAASSAPSSGFGSNYYKTTTDTSTKGEFERTNNRFSDIRKKAFAEAEKELAVTKPAGKPVSQNPHLDYIRNRNKKTNQIAIKVKNALSSNTLKQAAIITGIIGLKAVTSILNDQYRSIFTADKK